MFNRHKIIAKSLQERLNEIEHDLCPNETHDFYILSQESKSDYDGGMTEVWNERVIKCKRCKKKLQDSDRIYGRFKYFINGCRY